MRLFRQVFVWLAFLPSTWLSISSASAAEKAESCPESLNPKNIVSGRIGKDDLPFLLNLARRTVRFGSNKAGEFRLNLEVVEGTADGVVYCYSTVRPGPDENTELQIAKFLFQKRPDGSQKFLQASLFPIATYSDGETHIDADMYESNSTHTDGWIQYETVDLPFKLDRMKLTLQLGEFEDSKFLVNLETVKLKDENSARIYSYSVVRPSPYYNLGLDAIKLLFYRDRSGQMTFLAAGRIRADVDLWGDYSTDAKITKVEDDQVEGYIIQERERFPFQINLKESAVRLGSNPETRFELNLEVINSPDMPGRKLYSFSTLRPSPYFDKGADIYKFLFLSEPTGLSFYSASRAPLKVDVWAEGSREYKINREP